MSRALRTLPLLACVLIAACSQTPLRPTGALLDAQQVREAKLSALNDWTLEGRLAVTAGGDGGSGSLVWERNGATFDFLLRAPVTGRSFRLHGNAEGVTLRGLDQGPVHAADARILLARQFGWLVPIAQLDYWVRGMRAPDSSAELSFGSNGLPLTLVQDGWTVEYRDWYADVSPPVPRKVFAQRADNEVRLVIQRWTLR